MSVEPITDNRLKLLRAMAKGSTSMVRWGTADVQELIARVDRAEDALREIKRLDEWSHNNSEWPGWNVWPMIRAVYTDGLDEVTE